jgi:asparagine synthase (glutamine-hydrolysing)
MSGILGILNRDGAPADRDLLEEMTRFMAYRGPDAQEVWCEGAVGFGHTLLRTTRESDGERQPCTLDGQVWIAADARVDARAELMGKLESAGRREVRRATDAELILHAYQVWGEECPEHLMGDFAFLIWDGRRRVLFGARDRFGLKPFYYAEAGSRLLCSNTLNCLRLDPEVSDELNDLAVADFLLFGWNQDPATTYYAGIQRLSPGHCLICTEEALRIRRYWTLEIEEVRYQRAHDYVAHFRELFEEAVKDRIRTDRVAVYMSGGLDSTLIAAVANRVMGEASGHSGVRACTVVYDRIIPDEERKYSRLAADFLRIPIEYVVADDYELYDQDRCWQFSKPEPGNNPLAGIEANSYRKLTEYTRVALTGMGGDPTLCTDDLYIADYLRFRALGELITGIGWCFREGRRIPRLGFRSLIKSKLGKGNPPYRYRDPNTHPAWLNAELDKRYELSDRWNRLNPPPSAAHNRSRVRWELEAPMWPCHFEAVDPGVTRFPMEQRHPFFDLRLATFLAGLPALPWCQEKNLLRAAGRGILPDSIRLRPKTPLAGSPFLEKLRGCGPEWWAKHLDPVPELARYVNLDALSSGETGPVNLNYWLQLGRKPRKIMVKQGRV